MSITATEVDTHEWTNIHTGQRISLSAASSETGPLIEQLKEADRSISSRAEVHVEPNTRTYHATLYNDMVDLICKNPRHRMIARLILIVIFPFFMAALSQIQFTWACLSNSKPVPVTAQTLAAMFAGMLLGPFYGTFATILYIAYVFVGAPFAAAQKSVPIYEPGGLGPTGGYIIGFALLTLSMGHATSRGLRSFRYGLALIRCQMRNKKPVVTFHPFLRCVFNFFLWAALGHFGLYTLGILWLQAALKLTLENALKQGLVCFLIGDVLKTAIAAFITPALWIAAIKIAQRFTFIKPEEAKELVAEP